MKLLEPFTIGPLPLGSRVVMAPSRVMADDYIRHASAGLIISEPVEVDPRNVLVADRPGLFYARQGKGWRRVVERVHEAGGRIFIQLSHLGRAPHPQPLDDGERPVALEDIPQIVDRFVDAALLARDAGFDGVEIDGADGHLIDRFLRSGSNRRSDAYGGSAQNRARFLLEVIEAVSAVWGIGRVGVRLSPWSDTDGMSDDDPVETFGHAAEALDQIGIAYIHLVEPHGHKPSLAESLRRRFGGALIVGGGYDRDAAEAAIRAGTADLVAFESDVAGTGPAARRPFAGRRAGMGQKPKATPTRPPVEPLTVEPAMPPLT